MSESIEHPLPLAVIGCGPAGLAALWHARFAGLRAVGFEAGPAAVANVHGYMSGLSMLSPAAHYELPGLPLDCRDPAEVTREELLSYYARAVQHGPLHVQCRSRCVALVPVAGGVEVHLDRGGERRVVRARDVIVTAWYQSRRLVPAGVDWVGNVQVLHGLRDPALVAGRRCVVVGGGTSAYEHASALMLHGHAVTIVARGRAHRSFHRDAFRTLLAATGSALLEHQSDVRVSENGLVVRGNAGQAATLPCDVVVACIGQQINEQVGALLVEAGVISSAERDQLRTAPTGDDLARRERLTDVPRVLERVLAARPDLSDRLFRGVRGIRLAGGAVHLGGAHTGVMNSMYSAELAVDAILGRDRPAGFDRPLAQAMLQWQRPAPQRDVIAELRPVGLQSWTRTPRVSGTESANGQVADTPLEASKYVRGNRVDPATLASVLEVADGQSSVRELSTACQVDYDELVLVLCALWRSNGLSWLPRRVPPQRVFE